MNLTKSLRRKEVALTNVGSSHWRRQVFIHSRKKLVTEETTIFSFHMLQNQWMKLQLKTVLNLSHDTSQQRYMDL